MDFLQQIGFVKRLLYLCVCVFVCWTRKRLLCVFVCLFVTNNGDDQLSELFVFGSFVIAASLPKHIDLSADTTFRSSRYHLQQ